jgi:anaerobic nitric oxide reductase transcription regulator
VITEAANFPLLAGFFMDGAQARLGLGGLRLTPAARERLCAYDWPGNVRELQHLLLRAALRASEGRRRQMVLVDVEHLGLEVPAAALPCAAPPAELAQQAADVDTLRLPIEAEFSLTEKVDDIRRRIIQRVLERSGGKWAEAARRLRLDRGNLHRMAQRLGLLPRHGADDSDG